MQHMTRIARRIDRPSVLVLAVIAAMFGYRSLANRAAAPQQPSRVATVNLETVFNGLDERARVDSEMTALAESLDKQGQEKREEVEGLINDLELFPVGSKQYEQAQQEVAEKTYHLQAFHEWSLRKLELAKSSALRGIYDHIKQAARDLAEENQYDIVFVDDSVVALPDETTEAETWRQISARRTLYANPAIDISEAVIAQLNGG